MGEHKNITYITLSHVSYDHRSHTYLLACAEELYKGAVGRDLSVSNNDVNACQPSGYCFWVCSHICLLDNFRVSQQHRERNCYMLLNIVFDDLHHISTYTFFI